MSQSFLAHQRGDLLTAVRGYLQVLEEQPDHVEALQLLGTALLRLGHVEDAGRALDRALQLDARHVAARVNRARQRQATGDLRGALADVHAALRLAPERGEALRLAAHLEIASGRPRRALKHLRGTEQDAPIYDLLAAMARQAMGQGRAEEALWLLEASLEHADGAWIILADLLHTEPTLGTADLIRRALARPEVDHQRLERAARRHILEAVPGGVEPLDPIQALALLRRSPLVIPYLLQCSVAGAPMERLLTAARSQALRDPSCPLPLVEALAVQAWWSEYAWIEPPEDTQALSTLRGQPGIEVLARVAMFRPPDQNPGLARALHRPGWERGPLPALVRHTLATPERDAHSLIDDVGDSTDPTSLRVRAQYETHPYPRRVSFHQPEPIPFAQRFGAVLPPDSVPSRRPLRVLVAGCGTGQHALSLAAALSDVQLTGLDLSGASLARAQGLAREHGVERVRFVRGDILSLDDRRYDFIDSVGVLHHMDDPLLGWRSLRDHLAPGGLMRVGLYTERSRAAIVAARTLAAERGWTADEPGLGQARAELLALPEDHPAAQVRLSPDFYSLSGLRDLVFHVSERRFHPAQVGAMAAELGLEVLAIQPSHPRIPLLYREQFPDDTDLLDLGRWDRVEAAHPWIFAGMLVLWCRPAQG